MQWLLQILTWWNGQTLNTRFHTWRNGELVGQDEFGNSYYRTNGGKLDPALGYERRWVIYAGESDGSKTTPPTAETYVAREWEMPHQANMTGTAQAYRPAGSLSMGGVRPAATGDYKAWTPGS
jgi:NADH:ubiquinone oxidoreductase subunit